MSDPTPDPAASARADLDAVVVNIATHMMDGLDAALPGIEARLPAFLRAAVTPVAPLIWPAIKLEVLHVVESAAIKAIAGLKDADAEMFDSMVRQAQAMLATPAAAQLSPEVVAEGRAETLRAAYRPPAGD